MAMMTLGIVSSCARNERSFESWLDQNLKSSSQYYKMSGGFAILTTREKQMRR